MGRLLASVFPRLRGRSEGIALSKLIERIRAGAGILLDEHGLELFDIASQWTSDTLHGWAAIAVGSTHLELDEQLRLALRFADDHHFGVREWAWLGVHDSIVAEPGKAIAWLGDHVDAESAHVRPSRVRVHPPHRHVEPPHSIPEGRPVAGSCLARPAPPRTDPAKYVTNSVANWLNDASKTCPSGFRVRLYAGVIDECGPAVEPLCRHALRTIRSHGQGTVRFLISTE